MHGATWDTFIKKMFLANIKKLKKKKYMERPGTRYKKNFFTIIKKFLLNYKKFPHNYKKISHNYKKILAIINNSLTIIKKFGYISGYSIKW